MNWFFVSPAGRRKAGALLALLSLATACTYSHGDPAPCTADTSNLSYSAVISPIFDRNCRECHSQSVAGLRGGGTNLDGYQELRNYPVSLLLGVIEHTPGYQPMPQFRSKISECDIILIKAWINAGYPQ